MSLFHRAGDAMEPDVVGLRRGRDRAAAGCIADAVAAGAALAVASVVSAVDSDRTAAAARRRRRDRGGSAPRSGPQGRGGPSGHGRGARGSVAGRAATGARDVERCPVTRSNAALVDWHGTKVSLFDRLPQRRDGCHCRASGATTFMRRGVHGRLPAADGSPRYGTVEPAGAGRPETAFNAVRALRVRRVRDSRHSRDGGPSAAVAPGAPLRTRTTGTPAATGARRHLASRRDTRSSHHGRRVGADLYKGPHVDLGPPRSSSLSSSGPPAAPATPGTTSSPTSRTRRTPRPRSPPG